MIVLGLVSLMTDISHEMLYPVVPLFLTATLGAPMTAVGLIEGLAECTANLLKVASGWYSDRIRRPLSFLFVGYGLSAVSKPLLALATSWPLVLVSRLFDRVGKGVRTSPRDSLLAASCAPYVRGRAFGLHRGMDTAGAVLGPLVALLLLSCFRASYRSIFLIAFIPALAGVAAISLVRPTRANDCPFGTHEAEDELTTPRWVPNLRGTDASIFSPQLRRFVIVIGLFSLGNSSDVFLLLRARHAGFNETSVLLLYILYNMVYAVAALPAGWLSDRFGRRAVMLGGFATFGLVYFGFAWLPHSGLIWPLFAIYGLYGAATEGVAKAHVTDLAPPEHRGTCLGLLQTVQGLLAFAASLIAGLLWTHVAPFAPFAYGAACALVASVLLLAISKA